MVSYMANGCAVEDHLYLWSYLPRFSRHLPADGVEELLLVGLLRRAVIFSYRTASASCDLPRGFCAAPEHDLCRDPVPALFVQAMLPLRCPRGSPYRSSMAPEVERAKEPGGRHCARWLESSPMTESILNHPTQRLDPHFAFSHLIPISGSHFPLHGI